MDMLKPITGEERSFYYQTTNQIQLPPNPQWRYWKFFLPDGTWKRFKGINSIQQLRDYLVQYNPVAFYYSTSEFLNQEMPDKIEHPNYQIADQIFLQNQSLVIDIDNHFGTEQIKKAAFDVYHKMEQFKDTYRFERMVLTGRGIRLEFKDLSPKPNLLPHEKEEWVKRVRKEFCQINLSEIPGVDSVVAWDTRRVIKCIGSPNPHNRYTTTILADPAYIPAIPGKFQVNEMTGGTASSYLLQEQGNRPDQELGTSPSLYFGKFIRNKVEGTKDRFVPYFTYDKKFQSWKKDLEFLQKNYGLSTIYVVDDYTKVLAISVDAVPELRLNKIYRASKSPIKRLWEKFHNAYIRTSSFFDINLRKMTEQDLHPLFKIDNSKAKLYPLSKPHIEFINHIGFNTDSLITVDKKIIGNKRNTIYETYFGNRAYFDESDDNRVL
jgi:hypothetical protein